MCKIISRINELAAHEGISIGAIEKEIGASRGVLSKAIKNGTDVQSKWLALICEKFPHFSPQWILLGEGEMIIDNNNAKNIANTKNIHTESVHSNQDRSHVVNDMPPTAPTDQSVLSKRNPKQQNKSFEKILASSRNPEAIPLVSVQAVGGFAGRDFSIQEHDIEGYYIIPKFRHLDVDFLIEVTGDSMMPRFFPGDIIACSIITNPRFIQWNKAYLIATREDGMIVKRLRRSTEPDCLLAVSDNEDYEPFDIPKSEIDGLARVVGVIHVE
ncbi:MAG: hypothetical protein HDS08_07225 [Bacteroides sp.]|nr:hypothetical protein [Bacteroides sp.]